LDQLSSEIELLAGHPLNIASPKQLGKLLFEELGLPVLKKTKTGPSTDAGVLAELAGMHPLPAKIVLHRQYAKLLNTYVDSLPELVDPATGRVHASLNQGVAATGRLSSSNPNLQNIPVRTQEGREIRSAFRACCPEGDSTEPWKLLAADYSQIELRVLAHLSADQSLKRAFVAGEDIHTLVASQVEGVPRDQVDRAMRRRAKAVNFGILYGQSPFGLAKALGIPQEEAAQFIDTYFSQYPSVQGFLATTLNQCREQGFVTTLLGRRRSIQGVRSVPADLRDPKTGSLRQLNLPERTAVNTVIQGSAADLIKLAMIAVDRRLNQEQIPANMILQIHDELLLEVDPTAIDSVAQMVREEMTQVMQLDVPLSVDIKWGNNWADCQQWDG
jgi:DNA polymerase-1